MASFGSFVTCEALGLSYRSQFGPGPGFFLLWIGIGILACLLLLIGATGFRSGDEMQLLEPKGSALADVVKYRDGV